MIVSRLSLLLFLGVSSVFAGDVTKYFVSLKASQTFENLINYDNAISASQHIKPLVEKSFSFGKFSGFTGEFSREILSRLASCPLVQEITPDIVIRALDTEVQNESPRHLARLSQRQTLSDPPLKYVYNGSNNGKGVTAYVIDSGITLKHPEFEGRATSGKDFTGEGSGDLNGHGTHVAGVIGSKTYGVAKNVDLLEIKALDFQGAGSLSTIISALEYAVKHRENTGRPGVANLSLGAARNSVLNQAINAAVDSGLVIVVAAGNSNVNACGTSPASAASAITVGAIDDRDDSLTSFSNWGECVDIFASGSYVASVANDNTKKPRILSGTSMSSPIVAGQIANMLSEGIPASDVKDKLNELATEGAISRRSLFLRPYTPNKIAYNGVGEDAPNSDDDN